MMAEMPEPLSTAACVAYQLRVFLRGISPLIWRRLLVRSDSTIADLHATLQTAFDWNGEHLHRFVIHGRVYGEDGLTDPRRVQLFDLGLCDQTLEAAKPEERAQCSHEELCGPNRQGGGLREDRVTSPVVTASSWAPWALATKRRARNT